MKLATRLQLVISGISLVLFLAVFVIVSVRLNAYSKTESENYISKNLDIYANDLMSELESLSEFLRSFNAIFPNGISDGKSALDVATRFSNFLPNQLGFYCTTEAGGYYDGTGWIPPADYNPKARPWFLSAKKDIHKTAFTDIYIDAMRGIPMTTISRALLDTNGNFYGVVAVDYSMEQIGNIVKKLNESSDDIVFILASNGKFIAHNTYKENENLKTVERGKYGNITEILLNGGQFVEAEMNDSDYILSSKILGDTKWVICYGQKKTKANEFANTVYAMLLSFFAILFLALVLMIGFVARKMLKPINRTAKSLTEIAQGTADLSQRIETQAFGEVREIVDSFNQFSTSLEKIVTEIKDSKNTLTSAGEDLQEQISGNKESIEKITENIGNVVNEVQVQTDGILQTVNEMDEIGKAIGKLDHIVGAQTDSVSHVSSVTEEMVGSIKTVNESVEKLAQAFDEIAGRAEESANKQETVSDKITIIESQSNVLEESNQAIATIAEQTNLLAMNAAIESAHAGEAGKGFSVVADEIRKLSETSTEQSRTIGEELEKIRSSISTMVKTVSDSGESFRALSDAISITSSLVKQIQTAMDEQAKSSRLITESLEDMRMNSNDVQMAATRMQQGSKTIIENMESLKSSSTSIKASTNILEGETRNIRERTLGSGGLADIFEKLHDAIDHIASKIDLFR